MSTPRGSRPALRRGPAGWRDERGAAAVEFALVLPVIILLLFGIIEFGRAWNVKQVLTDAAREGARVAAVNNGVLPAGDLDPLVRTTVAEAAQRAGLDTDPAVLEITLSGISAGASSPAVVDLRYHYVPLFGTWVLQSSSVQLGSRFVMRNE
jgi:Flp pilus assembly protein TadG